MGLFIGIDEAGRGALAGPVCVGAVLMPSDFPWESVFALITKKGEPKLRDSKKLSAQQRETLFSHIETHGRLKHAAALVDAATIDTIGIVNATNEAVSQVLRALDIHATKGMVLLDAGLSAPREWQQSSHIRGDETIPAISCASIVAKVTRDRYMEELGESYAQYGFAGHKGYGTLAHREAILEHGLSPLHRRTFCGNLLHTAEKEV